MARFSSRMVLISTFLAESAFAQTPVLTRLWDANLGPAQNSPSGGPIYRGAVCPSGLFFLTNRLGRIVAVSGQGQVLADVNGKPEGMGIAIACNDNSELVVASQSQISRLATGNQGAFDVRGTIPFTGLTPSAVAQTGPGTYLLLGLSRSGGSGVIHAVNDQGMVTRSFGSLPAIIDVGLAKEAAFNGSVAWNRQTKQLLYLPESPYEFQIYEPERGLIRKQARLDPDFHEMGIDASGNRLLADRVAHAAYLPDGDLLVQVFQRSLTSHNTVGTSAYLEKLSPNFDVKSSHLSTAGFGQLQGISQDGTLYFSRIGVWAGIHITAAKLSQ